MIATPIILNIIDDSKREAKIISAENYLSAVEQVVANKNLEGKFNPNKCEISETNEVLTCTGEFDKVHCEGDESCTEASLEVKVDGEAPKEVLIKFKDGSIANKTILAIGNLSLVKTDNKLKELSEGSEHLSWKNVRATTPSTKTTGNIPAQDENGNIIVGSEFKIKVNNNSGWLTFFALSNDGDYVNLIAEQNITPDGRFTSEPQDGDQWYITSSNGYDTRFGPQTAFSYLSIATEKWENIPKIASFNYLDEGNQSNSSYGYKSIRTKLNEATGKYITTITPLTESPVTYINMRTRLPYSYEITKNTDCKSTNGTCPIWMVNYLYTTEISEEYYNQTNGKKNSEGNNDGYWILSSYSVNNSCTISYTGRISYCSTINAVVGIRPVITVLKSDLLRVME